MDHSSVVAAQRQFFRTGASLEVEFRRRGLNALARAIKRHEQAIAAALAADLNKSAAEGYLCEVGMVLSELSYLLRHLSGWVKPRRVATGLAQFPARSVVLRQPYGVVLIMAPWNYPFLLCLSPLIGALAAGNCCVLKPSPQAPASSALLCRIIAECFPPEYVQVVLGEESGLLEEKFDYIFFTGGTATGRHVMAQAAQSLTPVTLELGGKSPCIVDKTARLELAAKRLVFGKLLNAGQTCVAPDYLLVDRAVKEEFLRHVTGWIDAMYGQDPLGADGYVRMVNERQFDRVAALIDPARVYYGGQCNRQTLTIQPTILDGVSPNDPVMQEEIFGPLLPVLTFQDIAQAQSLILDGPRPLALYLFSQDRATQKRLLENIPFGGGCVNDTVIHLASNRMGFGGIGDSGMGSYRGRHSVQTFSHEKSVLMGSAWLDLPMRYPPYTPWKQRLIRRFLR